MENAKPPLPDGVQQNITDAQAARERLNEALQTNRLGDAVRDALKTYRRIKRGAQRAKRKHR